MNIVAGTLLGPYEIRSKIGEGGMGEVYRARDTKLGRDVAIKVLPALLSADAQRLLRFDQEARAAGALNHPNILVIHHIETHDGSPYIVSELLEGQTLRERMNGAGLPQRKALDFGLQIVRGLAAAHEKGIVHRDIKPENIFITNDGRVKILDFGLAKLSGEIFSGESQTEVATRKVKTDPGTVMGTIGYMSPEQLRGQNADARSDIFSFGAVFYEMLSGTRELQTTKASINKIALKPGAQLVPIVNAQFNQHGAAVSADGRWLAYQSDENNGRPEIYVRDLSEAGGRWQISTDGGQEPRWSPDGRELYYRNSGFLLVVPIDTHAGFQAGTPKNLFNEVYDLRSNSGVTYDVDPHGGRFLLIRPPKEDVFSAQVRVVLNWLSELQRWFRLNEFRELCQSFLSARLGNCTIARLLQNEHRPRH